MLKLYYLSVPHCAESRLLEFGKQMQYNRNNKGRIISVKREVHDGKIYHCRHEENEK